jgi:hypothetical protein
MMPSFSIRRNSSLAAASFSPSRRRKRHDSGGPLVTMWCSTLLEGRRGSVLEAFTTAGKSANSRLKLSSGVAATIVGGGGLLEAGDW